MKNFLNKYKYRVQYYDFKYPYIKFILLAIVFITLFSGSSLVSLLYKILAFAIAVVLHEVAHGVVAYFFGDDTAKRSGRLTLNPAKHFDLEGLILPVFLIIFNSPVIIGSAKPVPVNNYRLKYKPISLVLVSLAGIITNILLAIVAILAWKYIGYNQFFEYLFVINIVLAAFNIIPIPPLDGSRILRMVLPVELKEIMDRIEANPFISLILMIIILRTNIFDSIYRSLIGILGWIL